jgi:carboxyl-terminal processing protease
MSRWNLAWLLGIASVALVGLAVSQSAPLRERDKDYELVRLMVDVLDQVESKYLRELDQDNKRKLVEDMINGGLERLDPHSSFINARKYKQFTKESKGKFGGIGIQINTERQTGVLTVISPLVGTPAYEAGILAGDIITKINGKPTDNMHISDAVDMIQGEPGQKLSLTVVHENSKEPVDIELTRAEIQLQSVVGDLRSAADPKQWEFFMDRPNKIAYIRLVSFSETTADELHGTLEDLKKEGLRGLILDLRLNPGGLLKSAVEVSNLFLDEGRIVSTKSRSGQEEVYDAEAKRAVLTPAAKYPMAILINKYSASASEIVAAALQDHGRAIVIGERSYGKGSVQNVIKMENGKSALKLTTASYWRPSGKNIHRFPDAKETDEWGVKPNEGYEVPMKDEERFDYIVYRRDRDFIQGKNPVPASKPKTEKEKQKKPFVDRVLNKALDYLHDEAKKAQLAPAAPVVVG